MALAISPNCRTAAAGFEQSLRLYDVASGKKTATLEGATNVLVTVVFSPDGKILAAGGTDSIVRLWDVRTGKNTAALKGHRHTVLAVAFSPDGKTLASGSGEFEKPCEIKLWDVPSGRERAALIQELKQIGRRQRELADLVARLATELNAIPPDAGPLGPLTGITVASASV